MSKPYAFEETIDLPLPAPLAAECAAELYLPAEKRSIKLLRLGTTDIGYWRVVSLRTIDRLGGYPVLMATMQRMTSDG